MSKSPVLNLAAVVPMCCPGTSRRVVQLQSIYFAQLALVQVAFPVGLLALVQPMTKQSIYWLMVFKMKTRRHTSVLVTVVQTTVLQFSLAPVQKPTKDIWDDLRERDESPLLSSVTTNHCEAGGNPESRFGPFGTFYIWFKRLNSKRVKFKERPSSTEQHRGFCTETKHSETLALVAALKSFLVSLWFIILPTSRIYNIFPCPIFLFLVYYIFWVGL